MFFETVLKFVRTGDYYAYREIWLLKQNRQQLRFHDNGIACWTEDSWGFTSDDRINLSMDDINANDWSISKI